MQVTIVKDILEKHENRELAVFGMLHHLTCNFKSSKIKKLLLTIYICTVHLEFNEHFKFYHRFGLVKL